MKKKSVQEIQDDLLDKMTPAERIHVASQMFEAAKKLDPDYFAHVQENLILEKLDAYQNIPMNVARMLKTMKKLDWKYLKKWAVEQET